MACQDGEPAGSGRRPPATPTHLLRLGIITYAVLVVAITVLPLRWDPWRHHDPTDDYRPQLRPLRGSGTNPFQSSDPPHMLGEHLGNVLLFAPYGLLVPLRWPSCSGPGG
jgi:hypothetical protein